MKMDELKDEHLLTIVKNVVEQHGCRLVDIDFETHRIDIEGSEDAKAQCARALQDILG
jgi:ribosome maturation factor RimP